MKATIIKKAILADVPSASGIEVINGIIYIIGDDSPYLFILNQDLEVIDKVKLYEAAELVEERVPKPVKADLECMTTLTINNYPHLLVLGSGSKSPQRDVAFLVKLPTNYNKKHLVVNAYVKDLYDLLRVNEEIVAEGELNLEGAATGKGHFILFNRMSGGSKNAAMYFKLEEFVEYIQGHTEMTPFPTVYTYNLPSLNNVPSGFSGACVFEKKIFFTASLEDTPNAIDDGEVLGSYIGWMKEENLYDKELEKVYKPEGIILLEEDGIPYKGKVESISIVEKDSDTYVALAVTDNDTGPSELLMLEIEL